PVVGKTLRHPFTGEDLPIVADEVVDPAFGTGAVKVTPAHDPTDFEIGQRHGLAIRNILDAHARISDAAPERFRGLDRYAARALDRLKGPAKQAALDGRVRFRPERWQRPYVQWLDNLRDWNISRQLWWGHQIPVWYCPNGHLFANVEDPTSCQECGDTDLEQDP